MRHITLELLRNGIAAARARPALDDRVRAEQLSSRAWLYVTQDGRPGVLFEEYGSDPISVGSVHIGRVKVARNLAATVQPADGEPHSTTAATVECDSEDPMIQDFFLRLLLGLLATADADDGRPGFESALQHFRDLLVRVVRPADRDLQGLWAELCVLDSAVDPAPLVLAWHSSQYESFDFLAEGTAVEVKSTRNRTRSHRFTSRQLSEPPRTLIASIKLDATGAGDSIFDIYDRVASAMPTLLRRDFDTAFFDAIGDRYIEAAEVRFDHVLARESLALFDARDVPALREPFPPRISEVTFKVDLEGIEPATPSPEWPALWRAVRNL